MAFISITRLRVRSLQFLPSFLLYTFQTIRQCKTALGFLGGSLLADRKFTFWTQTLWRDQGSMRAFMVSGEHLIVMPKLLNWCDEASVVHWTQDNAQLIDWEEADRRMRRQGRPSKVHHPSKMHASLGFDKPRTTRAAPIAPSYRVP
ncbi:MAG: hypothetical protein NVSMB6_26060 [Burkholderiaceae bacterium]